MKLTWLCVLIVAHSCCNIKASDLTDQDGAQCLVAYLQQKGKLAVDFIVKPSSLPYCRIFTTATLSGIEAGLKNKINEDHPNEADCFIKEMKNHESVDLYVKLYIFEKSNLSETRSRYEVAEDYLKIRLQCETGENGIIAIYDRSLGIKNETSSALEYNYCFAKYAADNELLPLQGIELNPSAIVTTDTACDCIIEKERQEREKKAREAIQSDDPKTINCVMDAYNNNNMFNTYIKKRVINYVEFPEETKDAETKKANDKLIDVATAVAICNLNVKKD